jgi:hypothetical protein
MLARDNYIEKIIKHNNYFQNMARKLLFTLRHENPMDDMQFILNIVKAGVAKIKILLMNEVYLFSANKTEIYTYKKVNNEWVSMNTEEGVRELSEDYIRAELKTILEHDVEVGYDNRLQSFDRNTFDSDYSFEYGLYLAFKNSGIKRVDSFQYVTDAIRQGYEIIKW